MGNQCYRDQAETYDEDASRPPLIVYDHTLQTTNLKNKDDDEFLNFAELNSNNTKPIHLINSSEDQRKVCIEDFDLLKVLGKGTFGKVMLVEHRAKMNLEELYAMKVLLKNQITSQKQHRHTMTERIILETTDHEFLVKLHYAFQTQTKLYLVVDFMGGGELFFYLRRYIRFSESVVQFYAAEILLAIEYMHSKNIIYRDLKPENILLDNLGHIKLADFGLSKIVVANEMAFSLCGTPEYLAPEIITSALSGYTKQCDWWSFGAVLFEMLTGAPPFYSSNRNDILKKVISVPIKPPNYLSEEAKDLLQSLLRIDPSLRLGYQYDAEEIKSHPFFASVEWDKTLAKSIQPPVQFQTQERNYSFFDQSLIYQEVKDTPVLNKTNQFNFTNFTYKEKTFNNTSSIAFKNEHDRIETRFAGSLD